MLKAAHEQLRELGHTHVALGVDMHNKGAIRLYERLGYERLDGHRWGQRRLAGEPFPEQPERPTAYELMVLDLEHNDRTRCWAPPTSWRRSNRYAPPLRTHSRRSGSLTRPRFTLCAASSMYGDAIVMWDIDGMNTLTKECVHQRRTCDNFGYDK